MHAAPLYRPGSHCTHQADAASALLLGSQYEAAKSATRLFHAELKVKAIDCASAEERSGRQDPQGWQSLRHCYDPALHASVMTQMLSELQFETTHYSHVRTAAGDVFLTNAMLETSTTCQAGVGEKKPAVAP